MKNKLFVKNLKNFFEEGFKSPFEILALLEQKIQTDSFSETVVIMSKNNEYPSFKLRNVSYHKNYTAFTYEFIKGGKDE